MSLLQNGKKKKHVKSMHQYRPLAFGAPLIWCSIKEFATWETEGFASAPTNIAPIKCPQSATELHCLPNKQFCTFPLAGVVKWRCKKTCHVQDELDLPDCMLQLTGMTFMIPSVRQQFCSVSTNYLTRNSVPIWCSYFQMAWKWFAWGHTKQPGHQLGCVLLLATLLKLLLSPCKRLL